jgi:acyl carrier protein
MENLTESIVLHRLESAFADAFLDLQCSLNRRLFLEEIDGLDSVSRLRLMLSVEDIFGFEISPKENSKLQTIGEVVDLILVKMGHQHERT